MKKILLFFLGLFLLPLYPILKRAQKSLSEKMQIGEKVIVVTRDFKGEKRSFQAN
jgi:hypothetical protein